MSALLTAPMLVLLAGEQGLLLKSGDGGASFGALASPYKGSFFGLLAARTGTLVAYGLRGNAFRSADEVLLSDAGTAESVLRLTDGYGVDAVALRYFNIFGRRQDPNGAYAAVVPKLAPIA